MGRLRTCPSLAAGAAGSRTAAVPLLVTLLLLLGTVPTDAQVLRGRVTLAGSGTPVAATTIVIFRGTTVVHALETDSLGSFEVELPGPGEYALIASRSGYVDVGPETFTAPAGRLLDIAIRMSDAVLLDPLTVDVRGMPRNTIDAARQRSTDNRSRGVGFHIGRDEIDRSGRTQTTELIQRIAPSIREVTQRPAMVPTESGRGYSPVAGGVERSFLAVQRFGALCPLALHVDGVQISGSDPAVLPPPSDIDTIEVYLGPHAVAGYYDRNGCGVALIWTRTGSGSPGYRRTLLGSVVLATLTAIALLAR